LGRVIHKNVVVFIGNLFFSLILHSIFSNILFKQNDMYAIVDIAGQQFKVEKGQEIYVHRLEAEEGTEVHFNNVLLVDDNGQIRVGMPVLEDTTVSAKVLAHMKGKKVLVFKKRRRKGYQKTNGYRDYLTKIQIENIVTEGTKIKKAKESVKSEEPEKKKTAKPSAQKKRIEKAEAETAPATEVVIAKVKEAPVKKTRAKTTARKKTGGQTKATPEEGS
jgi:large subunit ribosomal protein L21